MGHQVSEVSSEGWGWVSVLTVHSLEPFESLQAAVMEPPTYC